MPGTDERELLWLIRHLISHANSIKPIAELHGCQRKYAMICFLLQDMYDEVWESVKGGHNPEPPPPTKKKK